MNAYQAYRELLFARADTQGIPLSGTFELTPRCNFNCKMCYIHRSEQDAGWRKIRSAVAELGGGML